MRLPARGLCVLSALGVLWLAAGPGAEQRGDAPPDVPRVMFTNVATDAGLDFQHLNGASAWKHIVEIIGSGGLFFDYDNDGWIDVFLVDGGSIADPRVARRARHRLYRNRGDGTFEDMTATAGIVHSGYGMGACAADYDNDGWVDLYVTHYGPNVLYRNNGDGTFTDVSAAAGVDTALWSTSCAFADFDRDGHLDLFVTNYVAAGADDVPHCGPTHPPVRTYCHPLHFDPLPNVLYRNNSDGTFSDVTRAAGIADYRGNGLGIVVADVDDDGWPDVFVANDALPDFLFHNQRDGRFIEVALRSGVAVASDGRARAGMGAAFGEYGSTGRLDLVVTNHEHEMHTLFRNEGGLLFTDATMSSGIGAATRPYVGFGVAFLDYDNDGYLDLAIANGHVVDNVAGIRAGGPEQPNLLLRSLGGRRLVDVSRHAGPGFALERVSRLLAVGDIDNDGDLDLLITNNGGPVDLLRNEGGSHRNALLVRTVGTASNRDGVGARLRLTAGGRTQVREVAAGSSYLGQNDSRVHFGLGSLRAAERLEIRWPSGRTDVVRAPPINAIITVREGDGIVAQTPFTR